MSDNTAIFVVVGVVLVVVALCLVPWGKKRCECYKESNSAQFTVNTPKYNPPPPNPPPMMRQAIRSPQTLSSRPKEGWAKATPPTLPQFNGLARAGNVLDNPWIGGFPGQMLNGPNGATNLLETSAQGVQEDKALMATIV